MEEPKPPAVVVLAPNKTVVVVVGPVDIRLPATMPANPEAGAQIQPPLPPVAAAEALLPLKPPFPFPLPAGVVGVVPPAPPLLRFVGFVVVE